MPKAKIRIGVVAPASRLDPAVGARVAALVESFYADRVFFHIHPQCALSAGHFAGDDEARAEAFVEIANDSRYDAVWFARGGYGSGRIVSRVLPALKEAAWRKVYLGYSDIGSLLGALYQQGLTRIAHGPMPADIARTGGEKAVARALRFLVDRSADTLEPSVDGKQKTAAFNITILGHLIGTPFEPDLSEHVLMLEEVSEPMYRIDRTMLQITSHPAIRRVAGIRLGRCSAIPPNDPDFGETEEQVTRRWCEVSAIPYLGRADIGHDVENKIVPFGRLDDLLSA